MGLVNQVSASQIKTMVKRLTKTFVTLSLAELATRVGLKTPQEAERLIVNMIDEGSIQAKISQKDGKNNYLDDGKWFLRWNINKLVLSIGMVRFDSDPEQYDSIPMLNNLEENINACIGLDTQLLAMEEDIILNPQYIKKNASTTNK